MNDDDLRAALSRRASPPLTDDQRNDVLRAARVRALEPKPARRPVWPRLAGLVAATAAVLVLVIIVLPILLSPPGPARPSANPGVTVLSTQQLTDLAEGGSAVGSVVIADATVVPLNDPSPACDPAIPCPIGELGTEGGFPVTGGYRDTGSTSGTPVAFEVGGGDVNRWITVLEPPIEEQRSAFFIMDTSVEYLGPAQIGADGNALQVSGLPLDNEKTPTDNVYVVHGWWWSGMWPNCPAQPQSQPVELDYYCNGFWLTPDRPATTSTMNPPQDGLLLAAGDYPAWSDQHSPGAPVEGTFLVRSAGCQLTLDNRCPVWRLVGKLDDQAVPPPTPPSPTPSPSVSQTSSPDSGLSILSAEDLSRKAGDTSWAGRAVLADIAEGDIQPINCPQPAGGYTGCDTAFLAKGNVRIDIGVRDATPTDGVQQDDGNGYRWVQRLETPSAGLLAFTIGHGSLEYLGPAYLTPNGGPVTVADLLGVSSTLPSDGVIAVAGWLTTTPPAPCAFPPEGLKSPMPDIGSYYCGGSWLTDAPAAQPVSGLTIDGGIHVQGSAWDDFALPPGVNSYGTAPVRGVYLVRNAGCPEVITGNCPVWRMVGRLDESSNPSPLPAPNTEPPATPVAPPESPVTASAPPAGVQYVHLDQALGLAESEVNQSDPQLRSYAAGSYQTVSQILLGANRLTELPDGLTWETTVWGIQFVSGDILTTVYLDLFTGDVVDVGNAPLPADPTPVHKSDIVFGDPTIHTSNGTAIDVSIYVNGSLAAIAPAQGATQIDPTQFGLAPWTVVTKSSTGRQLTTGVLDPRNVWGATGDSPIESVSFLERIDLSCGRLDMWAGAAASGPAPPQSFLPGDCDP